MTASNTQPERSCDPLGAHPQTPGTHQQAGAQWTEIPEAELRKHLLAGAFYISHEAKALFDRCGLSLDALLSWFNEPRPHVRVGDRLLMGNGLQAFFGFDDSQTGPRAFFVEISLTRPSTHH